MKNRKGYMKGQTEVFSLFVVAAVMLLVLGMVLAFSFIFLAQAKGIVAGMNSSSTDTSAAQQAITKTSDAIGQFPQWLTLIVLAIVIVGLLGLILAIIAYVRNSGIAGGGGGAVG